MSNMNYPTSSKTLIHVAVLLAGGIIAVSFAACSSGTPIEEGEYVGGMPVDTAVVQPVPGGGYRTISGDPFVAMNGNIEQTSMLPYGGGDEGIRQAEDETPFYSTN